jgi:hypothetical protein
VARQPAAVQKAHSIETSDALATMALDDGMPPVATDRVDELQP